MLKANANAIIVRLNMSIDLCRGRNVEALAGNSAPCIDRMEEQSFAKDSESSDNGDFSVAGSAGRWPRRLGPGPLLVPAERRNRLSGRTFRRKLALTCRQGRLRFRVVSSCLTLRRLRPAFVAGVSRPVLLCRMRCSARCCRVFLREICSRLIGFGLLFPVWRPQSFSAGKCSKWAGFPGMISPAAVCFRRCIPRELFDCSFAPGLARLSFCRTTVRLVRARPLYAA